MAVLFQSIWVTMLAAQAAASQPAIFEKREFESPGGDRLQYRIYRPVPVAGVVKYPMVIWLHDIFGAGWDNGRQIKGTNAAGATVWTQAEVQDHHPSFVVAPQCPIGSLWVNMLTRKPSAKLRLAPELVEELVRDYPVDPDRIYLAGQSMGGYAVWALLEMRPDLFAAAIPASGGARSDSAPAIFKIPIWVFHGKRDLIVRVGESRNMVRALREAGGDPRYTEYPTLGHSRQFWKTVFANPELPEWLFSQTRQGLP